MPSANPDVLTTGVCAGVAGKEVDDSVGQGRLTPASVRVGLTRGGPDCGGHGGATGSVPAAPAAGRGG